MARQKPGKTGNSKKWWRPDATPEERSESITQTLNRILASQNSRRDQFQKASRQYHNMPMPGLGIRVDAIPFAQTSSLGLNVVKSCVDTFAATLTKEKPKVWFQTSGGDWDLQNKAKDLIKYVAGQFYESKVYDKNAQLAVDAGVWGTGIYKIVPRWPDKRLGRKRPSITVERVIPIELHCDDQESIYGKPANIYQTKWIDRSVLMAEFQDVAEQLSNSKQDFDRNVVSINQDSTADQLLVIEAWHLPPYGRHTMIVFNGPTLVDEDYSRDRFPFVFYRRSQALSGFWGIGLAKELEGIQLEINVLLKKIQRAHHMLGNGHWVIENSSKIRASMIDDVLGSEIRYTGVAPRFETPQPISGDIYQHLWALEQHAYKITGISELQAQGQKPAGLNSGEAIRTYRDTVNVRAQIAQDNFHAVHLELAEHFIDLGREISARFPDFSARVVSGRSMERVTFLDVDMEDEEYVLQMYPTNALADDPAMRMSQVQELAQVGWIDETEAKRLLNFPDLETWNNEQSASHDVVEDIIEKMLKEGKSDPPEPFMDLQAAIKQVQMAYLLNRRKGAPEDRLQLLRDWMVQAQDELQKANPPAPPPGPQGPPGPPNGPPPMPMNGASPMSPVGRPPLPPGAS